MALFIYSLVVVWFHKSGHELTFSLPTLVPEEGRAIVCRHVDDPEAVSYEEKMPQPLPKQSDLKTWIAQLTELLSQQ